MNSIGSHFFALDPSNQAARIAEFAEAIQSGNPGMSAYALAVALRSALTSMSAPGRVPPISVQAGQTIHGWVEVRGRGYRIEIAPGSIYVDVGEDSTP